MAYAASFLANALRQRDQSEAAKAAQLRQMAAEAVSYQSYS